MNRFRLIAALLALVLASACTSDPQVGRSVDIAIINAAVVDAVSGTREGQVVLVDDGRIVAVESMPGSAYQAREILDASGLFVTPGLWDMHVHFIYDERLTEVMPSLFLDFGITSVRDTGGNMERLAALRSRWQRDPAAAPDIFISGPLLDGERVVYDGGDPGRPPLGTDVATPDMARQRVESLQQAGADFIKIYELVSPEVFAALVSEARSRNLPIASHVPLSMTADTAGPFVDSMEHLRNVELACATDWQARLAQRRADLSAFKGRGYDLRSKLHREHRVPSIQRYDEARCDDVLAALQTTTQVPTLRLNTLAVLRPFEREEWQANVTRLPAAVQTDWLGRTAVMPTGADPAFSDWSLFLVGRMNAADVPIGAGTDTPIGLGIPGESLHHELALLVESGLTAAEAFHAATVQPAIFMQRQDTMGQVQPGFEADLLLLSENPLEEISATRSIQQVMSNGIWVRARQQ